MKRGFDRSFVAALVAGLCSIAFAALLFFVARSFRSAISEMAEEETRVTVVNGDGSVFYDTDSVVGSHATREEVRRAFAEGRRPRTSISYSSVMIPRE